MKRLGFVFAFLAVALTGCASLWSDVKDTAKVCAPTAEADATVALPYVGAYAVCLSKHGDCTGILSDLKALGVSDLPGVEQCATAKLHNATVEMAAEQTAP